MHTHSYMLGIDPGQTTDPTALALLQYDNSRDRTYQLIALHQFPLGTPYTDIPANLNRRLNQPPLHRHTAVTVDATGVGKPIVELFRTTLTHVPVYAITITAGHTQGGTRNDPHVPKRDLIDTTTVALYNNRLHIAAAMPHTQTLTNQLLDFRRTTTDAGNDTYNAPNGHHDDLVLALSLALWTAQHRPPAHPPRRHGGTTNKRLPDFAEIVEARHRRLYNW